MIILVGFLPTNPALLTSFLLLMLTFFGEESDLVMSKNSVLMTSLSSGNKLTGLESRSYQFSVNSKQPKPS